MPMFSILSVCIGITDKMNAADLSCMQEIRQTRDRTNGHLFDSNTLLIKLSSPSVKSVELSNLRLMNVLLKHCCNHARNEPKGFTIE